MSKKTPDYEPIDRETARINILKYISKEGTCHVAIACEFGYSTTDAQSVLKELETDGLVQFDDYQKIWHLYPTKQRLEDLKKEIRQIGERVRLAFYEVGTRLKEIREKKLYELDGYLNFEEFVSSEFGFKKVYAHYQICAAQVFDELKPAPFTFCEQECIKEAHLRPLSKEEFTSDDRLAIWEEVQSELEDLAVSGKPAKLTAKLVEKHVMSFQESQVTNPPELPPLIAGTYCKVRLRSGHIDSELKAWNNKIVRVLRIGELKGYICQGAFGEEIEDCFFREELFELADTATHKFSIELSVEQLKQLPRNGSLENAITYLLSSSNLIQFPQKAS